MRGLARIATPATPPHNIELEQALLGAILLNNDAYHLVGDFLEPQHFHEALHVAIYEIASRLITNGRRATPVTLKNLLPDLPIGELTTSQYLARLVAEATTVLNARDYAMGVCDLAMRRRLVKLSEDFILRASRSPIDESLLEGIERELGDLRSGARHLGHGVDWASIPLTADAWMKRDTPAPDLLMGCVLTTTTRMILNAPTGGGKTHFAMTACGHIAAGLDFLHWRVPRPARVLFIDGEMSVRLLKQRITDTVRRLGVWPDGLLHLSHADIPDFPPLNTPAGFSFIRNAVAKHRPDLVVFDNIMSLIIGKMVDEEAWLDVIPLLKWLTDTAVGQLWIHHTGYNKEHGFGTSTREWMMDTVALMTEVKRPDADISFTLEFLKARERTSENRGDFDNVTIALVNDEWTCSAAMNKPRKISPLGTKFLAALKDALASSNTTTFQRWRAVTLDQWWAECKVQNLIDGENPKTDSAMRSKYKKELIGANAIACNDKLVWLI